LIQETEDNLVSDVNYKSVSESYRYFILMFYIFQNVYKNAISHWERICMG